MLKAAFEKHLRRPLLLMAVSLIVGTMMSAILVCYGECHWSLLSVRIPWLILSLGLCAVYLVLNAFAWTLVLKWFGYPLRASVGITLWIRCEAFRWLPGSIWNFGARAMGVSKLAVPSAIGAASMVTELVLSITSRMLIVLVACACYAPAMSACLKQLPGWEISMAVAALATAAVVAGVIVVLRARGDQALWSHVELVLMALSAAKGTRHAVLVQAYYAFLCALHGLALKALIVGLNLDGDVPLLGLIAVNAAAWLIGFLAVFAPGGIIVREVVLATALSTWLSPTHAIAVAVTWRMLQVTAEATLFLCCLFCSRSMGSNPQYLHAASPN